MFWGNKWLLLLKRRSIRSRSNGDGRFGRRQTAGADGGVGGSGDEGDDDGLDKTGDDQEKDGAPAQGRRGARGAEGAGGQQANSLANSAVDARHFDEFFTTCLLKEI